MTIFKAVRMISHNGSKYPVGATIELDDKADRETIIHLKSNKAIESIEILKAQAPDLMADFQRLNGVGEKVAKSLVDAGIVSLEQLAEMTAEQIAEIKGISKTVARKIFKSFEEIED